MKTLSQLSNHLKSLPSLFLVLALMTFSAAKGHCQNNESAISQSQSTIAKAIGTAGYVPNLSFFNTITPSTRENAQGMAIYKGTFFALYNTGVCDVLKIKSKGLEKVGAFNLGSYAKTNHANSASFGREFAPGNTQFPLLYVSRCYKDYRTCLVEDVSLTGSKLVQTISIGTYRGEVTPESDVQWMVGDDGFLYMFGNTKRDWNVEGNKFVVARLRLPKLSEGSDVKLDLNDALEFYYLEDYGCTPNTVLQGCCVHEGIMFLPVGYGSFSVPSKLYVWDLKGRKQLNYIDLSHLTTGEIEDCDFNGRNLMMRFGGSNNVYQIKF